LRNALLPVVTLAGLHSSTLIGGAVLTETVFAWPGIGRLMYEALLQRDYNLLLGVFVVCSAMVLIFNLVTDLVYRMVDPRIYGARVSLLVGLVSTLAALAVGVPLGAIAGYFGGRIDDALMRFTEFFQTIPSFALAIVLVAVLRPSIYSIVASIAIVSWPPVARLVRGEVLSLRTREYVQ